MRYLMLMFLIVIGIAADEAIFTHYTYSGGFRYANVIYKEQYNIMPSWNPGGTQSVPIDPTAAYQSAQRRFSSVNKLSDFPWEVAGVSLIPINGVDDKWVYEVRFRYSPPIGTGPGVYINIIVMLDGLAIEPVLSEWDMINNRAR